MCKGFGNWEALQIENIESWERFGTDQIGTQYPKFARFTPLDDSPGF